MGYYPAPRNIPASSYRRTSRLRGHGPRRKWSPIGSRSTHTTTGCGAAEHLGIHDFAHVPCNPLGIIPHMMFLNESAQSGPNETNGLDTLVLVFPRAVTRHENSTSPRGLGSDLNERVLVSPRGNGARWRPDRNSSAPGAAWHCGGILRATCRLSRFAGKLG